jgi:hypothetical protein
MNTCIRYHKTAELPGLGVKLSVDIDEFYFEFVPPTDFTDVCAGLCLSEPVSGWLAYPRATRIIDLAESHDVLFKACSKTTRYEIERARKSDEVETEFLVAPSVDRISDFCEFYDAFAASKGLPRIRRSQLHAMASAGKLVISAAVGGEAQMLAMHAYFFDQHRARLTHSASLFRLQADSAQRRRIGRINRLLHWEDIVRFRELGSSAYDMGGWYTGNRNDALLRINSFKRDFGGTVVHEWDMFRAGSIRGWLYLRTRDLLHRTRRPGGN